MNFVSMKEPKSFSTMIQSQLVVVRCSPECVEFIVFDFGRQDIINRAQLLFKRLLQQQPALKKRQMTISEVYQQIKARAEQSIGMTSNAIILNVKLSGLEQPLIAQLPLTQSQLTPSESIAYLKQYNKAKQDFYKCEILRLKSKIYSLMTEVEDATNLIRSQSLQTKSSKDQIKNLKKELKILQEEKKKQQSTFFIEVGVQHEFSSQQPDIIEWLECPEVKQYSLDQNQLRHLTKFIEQQIKENQKILSLTHQTIPNSLTDLTRVEQDSKIETESQNSGGQSDGAVFSPSKVCFFQKSSERFRLQGYGLKTLESS